MKSDKPGTDGIVEVYREGQELARSMRLGEQDFEGERVDVVCLGTSLRAFYGTNRAVQALKTEEFSTVRFLRLSRQPS